jgi:general secretion pathway protein N
MRADGTADAGGSKAWAGPKTWLLAAVAGWALAIWALGLFGLGGRIEILPDDPSLLQRLPQAAKPGPERLGPLGQYSEIGARPLFSDDRRPQPFFINPEGEGEETNTFDFVLTSVLLTPRLTMAIVQPAGGGEPVRLKIGEAPESAPAWALASVEPRSVVFNGPEGERTLELRVFDGVGGEPPTAITVPQPGQAPRPPGQQGARAIRALAPPAALLPAPPAASRPAQPPSTAEQAEDSGPMPSPEAQAEAIRQRIEARRAQLLEQSKQPAPTKTP